MIDWHRGKLLNVWAELSAQRLTMAWWFLLTKGFVILYFLALCSFSLLWSFSEALGCLCVIESSEFRIAHSLQLVEIVLHSSFASAVLCILIRVVWSSLILISFSGLGNRNVNTWKALFYFCAYFDVSWNARTFERDATSSVMHPFDDIYLNHAGIAVMTSVLNCLGGFCPIYVMHISIWALTWLCI